MQNIIRDQTVNELDLYDLGKFVIYELLSSLARCAGYKLLQNSFQNKCGRIWVRVPNWCD